MIIDYDLIADEKKYLRALIAENDLIANKLKKELSHFFDRIFVDMKKGAKYRRTTCLVTPLIQSMRYSRQLCAYNIIMITLVFSSVYYRGEQLFFLLIFITRLISYQYKRYVRIERRLHSSYKRLVDLSTQQYIGAVRSQKQSIHLTYQNLIITVIVYNRNIYQSDIIW